MIVVRGKQAVEMTRAELEAAAARHAGVTLDLGAGDGLFAYRYARTHPEQLVIAVEPVRENVREASSKAAKKPERGGAPNVLYVAASVERMPPELAGIADEIFVTLPWGSLMRGLILGDRAVLDGVAGCGGPGARVRIVLNTRIFDEPVPLDARDLPEVTPAYVRETLDAPYAAAGLRIIDARWMDADEVASLGTTWAKRLSHRAPPRSVVVECEVGAGEGAEP